LRFAKPMSQQFLRKCCATRAGHYICTYGTIE
jgi:hypothetical protein